MADVLRLPRITDVRSEGGQVELDLVVEPDLLWFQGHFPGQPILPGVVQLDWALSFACQHLRLAVETARQFQVKYKSGIFPDDRLTLVLAHQSIKNHLSFEYRRGGTVCSSGQVVVDP